MAVAIRRGEHVLTPRAVEHLLRHETGDLTAEDAASLDLLLRTDPGFYYALCRSRSALASVDPTRADYARALDADPELRDWQFADGPPIEEGAGARLEAVWARAEAFAAQRVALAARRIARRATTVWRGAPLRSTSTPTRVTVRRPVPRGARARGLRARRSRPRSSTGSRDGPDEPEPPRALPGAGWQSRRAAAQVHRSPEGGWS